MISTTTSTPLKHLHPGWFLPVLALGALALAWLGAAPVLGDMAGAGALVLTVLATAVATALAFVSLVRWQRDPQALSDDLNHPARHAWVAAVPTALVLLAALGTVLLGPGAVLGWVWWTGAAWNVGVAVWVFARWLRPRAPGTSLWASVTPVPLLTVSGLGVAALGGSSLGYEAFAQAQLGLSMWLWVLTMGMLAARLAVSGVWPERMLPTVFLGAAPPAVVGLVLLQWGASTVWVWMAWGLAAFCVLWAAAVLRRLQSQPVGLTFWAPAYALALFAALNLRLAPLAGGGVFQTFALLSLAVVSLLVVVLMMATFKGLRDGSLLAPEPVAALQLAAEPRVSPP